MERSGDNIHKPPPFPPSDASLAKSIEEQFRDQKETFRQFYGLFLQHKTEQISLETLSDSLTQLFPHNSNSIHLLNTTPHLLQRVIQLSNQLKLAAHIPSSSSETPLPPAPACQPIPTTEAVPASSADASEAIAFARKIKARFGSQSGEFARFTEILTMYRQGSVSIIDVYHQVDDLFTLHPDLFGEFIGFLPISTPVQKVTPAKIKKPVPSQLEDSSSLRETLRHSHKRKRNHKEREIEGSNRELSLEDCQIASSSKRDRPSSSESIIERMLSNCDQVENPSYRLWKPTKEEKLECANPDFISEPRDSVLNNDWVLVRPCGQRRQERNAYEEMMFDWEDDRFHLDLLEITIESAGIEVKELFEKLSDPGSKMKGQFQLENDITPKSLRCIQQIYGEFGYEMIDLLREHPEAALPVILRRLEQKKKETSERLAQNKAWAKEFHAMSNKK